MPSPAPSPSQGSPTPLGYSREGTRSNFALYAKHASQVILGLFSEGKTLPFVEYPLFQTGDVWHLALDDLPPDCLYAYRCEGLFDEQKGLLYEAKRWLSDPYAKKVQTPSSWGEVGEKTYLACPHTPQPFDWQGVKRPNIPFSDLIIYEMHVRGFSADPSSQSPHPGTFAAIRAKIPYFKKLGVNALELMPIYEFDEIHCKDIQPHTGEPLKNYWGYNPLFFFAPMQRYAASSSPIQEFKEMVRELHRNGIEVILDVVYNHTGEGKEKDYFVHFRGIDNPSYYMVDRLGQYRNYSGCGNTLNTNHPAVQHLITESLSYWIEEMHVDGFRFDLASIFTRGLNGEPIEAPPIVKAISSLNAKLIAEAWDAAGLYQVGLFPKWGPWADWNGRYRDVVRRFIKGTEGYAGPFADAISGSESLFGAYKTPLASLNFITAHDGYSLRDLVTYQLKHNYENGEMNQDGNNQNDSWNCGAEGPSQNPQVLSLRERQMRNFILALFLSQGVPMILMGDEYGHTRKGNNNPYVQDNAINWFQWDLLKKNEKIFSYFAHLISFRKNHATLRQTTFLKNSDVDWHGTTPFQPDWSDASRFVAYTLKGSPSLYVAFNASFHSAAITLPPGQWADIVNTSREWDAQHFERKVALPSCLLELPPYSALLAESL